MCKTWLVGTALLLLAAAAPARAQDINYYFRPTPGLAPRPALSPYLNLLRGGNPAANYYLGVLAEQDRRAFETGVLAPRTDFDQLVAPPPPVTFDTLLPSLPQTGHASAFQFYGSFYTIPNTRPFIPYGSGVLNRTGPR